jgi:phage terminase large subunit-like protein
MALEWARQVQLRDWQRDEIRKIYDNPAGTRRAIISFGRKNAKTTLAAFLLLAHLVGKQSKANSQLVSARSVKRTGRRHIRSCGENRSDVAAAQATR